MELKDFGNHIHGLSQRQESKKSHPRMDEVSVIEFQHGSISMFFKEKHTCEEFLAANFLKKAIRTKIETKSYSVGMKYD